MSNSERPPVCDYEGSDYQLSFWDKGGRAYEDQVEQIALARLLPPGGKALLEIGAGAGRNTSRYHGFEQVVLLDYSRTQLQQAQKRLGQDPRYIFVAADAYRLPFAPGCFDAATMIRTLHHMADAPAVLHQVRQALSGGSVFILEFANKQNLKAILRYLTRRQEWSPFSQEPIEFTALNFDFHPKAVRRWLLEAGFQIDKQLTVSHYRQDFLKRHIPLDWLVRMDSLAQWSGDWWQFTPSVFVRAQASGDTPPAVMNLVFRCPECLHYPLGKETVHLTCPQCRRLYTIHDGIYDFKESTFSTTQK